MILLLLGCWMPRNGSGVYSLPEAPFVAGTVISSAAVNDDLSDIATALTGSLPRDGQAGMTGQFKATDGSLTLPSISFNNDTNTGFYRPADDQIGVVIGGVQVGLFTSAGLTGVIPIGVILSYAASTIPPLWLLCYGQNVSRTTYALLFAIIGTTYGAGDGTTTFGLPDLRGIVIAGLDGMGGTPAGRLTASYYSGGNPNVLGSIGGFQNSTLGVTNLPAYTPSGIIAVTNGAITSTSLSIGGSTSTSFTATGAATTVPIAATAVIISSSQAPTTATFTGTAQGGSATPIPLVQPSMVMNKIIFAGA